MKIFKNRRDNFLYFIYRLVNPIIDPVKLYTGLIGYPWFIRDLIQYKVLDPSTQLLSTNLYPVLDEKVSYTPFDAHYYYQQLWVFEKVLEAKPREHVDVASTYELSGYLSKIVPTTFIDLRPIKTSLKNLKIKRGDMLHMPFKDRSVRSLSSLHSIEHVGLGRYGGEINPQGTHQACKELSRILAKNGKLYISVPIGKEKVCFNAHRIFSPMTIISFFKDLRLISFSVVDDNSKFIENTRPEKYTNLNYGCGLFIFARQ